MKEIKSYLQQYIEERNRVRKLIHLDEWNIANPTHRYQINEALIIDLNPEVISCDGEASEEFVAWRRYCLLRARRELLKIDEQMNKNQPFTTDFHLLDSANRT